MNKSSNHHQTSSSPPDALRRSIEAEFTCAGVSDALGLAQALSADMARIFEYPNTEASLSEATVENDAQTAPSETGLNSLSAQQRIRICQRLNQSLADCTNLQLQCRQARWNTPNTPGQGDSAVCDIFSEIEGAAGNHAELLATRLNDLGGQPQGTLMVVSERSGLNEYHSPEYRGEADIDAVASALGIIEIALGYDIEWLLALGDSHSADLLGTMHHVVDFHWRLVEARQRIHPSDLSV